MIIKAVILSILLVSTCFAGEIQQVKLPLEVRQEIQVDLDDEIVGKVWKKLEN